MQPQAVVEVMGGSAAVHAPVRGLTDLRSEIQKGLRLEALHRTVEHIFRIRRSAGGSSTGWCPKAPTSAASRPAS